MSVKTLQVFLVHEGDGLNSCPGRLVAIRAHAGEHVLKPVNPHVFLAVMPQHYGAVTSSDFCHCYSTVH